MAVQGKNKKGAFAESIACMRSRVWVKGMDIKFLYTSLLSLLPFP